MFIIYITGDTHGEHARFISSPEERSWTAQDTIIVCGDFGYLFDDDVYEHTFLDDLAQRPYTICFVDGNHENFPAIFRHPEEVWNGGRIHRIRKNIIHLMRGQVFTIEGKRFFTMGGAYSIDRYIRKENISFWHEELPSNSEYHEASENLKRYNNQVDYVLTHTAPREIIRMMGHSPDGHDLELTGFLEYIMHTIDYQHWYFGHWHRDQQVAPKLTAVWFTVIAIPQDSTDATTAAQVQASQNHLQDDGNDMSPPNRGALLLTSFGLNTTLGANLIAKELSGEDLSAKTILLVSLASYGIDELLQSACLRMGFLRENIFLSVAVCDTQPASIYPECVDYVYVTEGNTFKVLRHLRQKNLMQYIRDCIAHGSTYIGASAGAMLAGVDVKLALEFDPDRYQTTDFTALGLFDGTVIPHYTAEECARFVERSAPEEIAVYKQIHHIKNGGLLRLS